MARKTLKNKKLAVRISDREKKAAKNLAEHYGFSLSQFVLLLLREQLDDIKQKDYFERRLRRK